MPETAKLTTAQALGSLQQGGILRHGQRLPIDG